MTDERPTDLYVAAGEVLRAYQQGTGVLAAWRHLDNLAGRPAALGMLLLRCDNESVAAGGKLASKILQAALAEAARHEETTNMPPYWGPGGYLESVVDPAARVVVDGDHYAIGDDTGGFRGHGGRRFDIEWFDGRKTTTRNLWHQGEIPPEWRHRYPDNARFVQPEKGPKV
ncbi:hypothetical protein AB0I81_30240 [Nonomuraea sp. NPDC050404]|uniref:hypothetical protein n=1 Tax=Nonomuraea sp. NPDC050404 TaxID=3155783 RepID=UPI0033CF8132